MRLFAAPRSKTFKATFMKTNGIVTTNTETKWARGLGWFSIALGVAQIAAPRKVGRFVGLTNHAGLMRLIGLREVATGIGILSQPRPTGWLWGRVSGDAIDLALLGTALATGQSSKTRVAAATAAVAGVTALDVACSQRFTRNPAAEVGTIRFKKSIVINRSPEEVYRFWRNFENLPRFMPHLRSVRETGHNRFHWVAKGPAGKSVEWEAELIQDEPNRLIAWRSCDGADVDNRGSVRFETATGGRGTIVKVEIDYRPPAGVLGATAARIFGQAPEKQVKVDLLRFKQMLETGVVATTEGQPAGRSRSTSRKFDDLVRA